MTPLAVLVYYEILSGIEHQNKKDVHEFQWFQFLSLCLSEMRATFLGFREFVYNLD